MVLISDGAFSDEARRTLPADVDVRFAAIGQRGPAPTGPATSASSPSPPAACPPIRRAVEAALVVQNFGRKPASVAVDIAAGDATVERVRLELAPGERRRHQLPNVFAADTRLRARLLTAAGAPADDDLALDDTAYAVVPPLPRRRVLRVGGADLYLDGALLSLGRTVTVDRLTLPAAEAQRARWADYDLVVFDGVAPAAPPTKGRFLYLDAHGPGSPFAGSRQRARSGDRRRAPRPSAGASAGSQRRQHRGGAAAGARGRATSRSRARSACRC